MAGVDSLATIIPFGVTANKRIHLSSSLTGKKVEAGVCAFGFLVLYSSQDCIVPPKRV